MASFRLAVLAVFLLSFLYRAPAQNKKFEYIGPEDGLSQSTVPSILQDSRGFMWFGTRDGLNKYDGYRFTVYKNVLGDSTSISNNIIQDILEDAQGNLWIATWGGGLNKFDRQTEKFIHYQYDKNNPASIASNFINQLCLDSRGNIWVGTRDQGLDLFDLSKNQFIHFPYNDHDPGSLNGPDVRAILMDSHQNIWVGTANGGLHQYNPNTGKFIRFPHQKTNPTSLSSDNIRFLFEDSRQNFWIGTYGGGLNLLDRKTGSFRHFQKEVGRNSLSHDYLVSIAEDASGNLWIGTENKGLCIFDPVHETFQSYMHNEVDRTSLSANSINSLYRDQKGNMWLGTFTGGISLWNMDANQFAHYKHSSDPNSLSHNSVLCIYEDADETIWVGTDGGGLNRFNPHTGKFTHLVHQENTPNTISGNYVLTVAKDTDGNLWIGTWGDGISVFNPKKNTYTHFKNDPADPTSLASNNVWTIFPDSRGNIWIGTYGAGLEVYNPATGAFIHHKYDPTSPNSISHNTITAIYEDRLENLWIGTEGGGLNLLDRKTGVFTHFDHTASPHSLSNSNISTIYEDHAGNVWIGTSAGLNKWEPETKRFTRSTVQGFANEAIMGILEDDRGHLWISTNHGIFQYTPLTGAVRNFTVADGLQANEFKDKAFCKTRSGKMYFGGKNGFNAFFPDSINRKSYTPPLVFTGLQLFNQSVPIAANKADEHPILTKSITETKHITLPYKYSVITLEFASLNYTDTEKKQYAYKLEGFDQDWREVGTQRTATYTNLDPGHYVFQVRGLTNEGGWSAEPTSLRLTIVPPFWKTWWFKALVGLTILLAFFIFYKIRMRLIIKRKKVLEKMVEERTMEIRRQTEEIERINALLKKHNKSLEENVEGITKARVMQKSLTFDEFKQVFPDDDTCLKYLAERKWRTGFCCKKCSNTSYSSWKSPYSRRCTRCNYIESATAFTIFHSIKFSILKAFYMLFLVHQQKTITAEELAQIVEISSKTGKSYKRKILDVMAEIKPRKKNSSWEDFIIVEGQRSPVSAKKVKSSVPDQADD